jgi:hypothetical protein
VILIAVAGNELPGADLRAGCKPHPPKTSHSCSEGTPKTMNGLVAQAFQPVQLLLSEQKQKILFTAP